jgi:hypothetical protein
MSAAETSALAAPERVAEALLRALSLETLAAAYAAWAELTAEHASARLRFSEARRRLEEEGQFLLNSLKAAGEEGVIAPEAPASAGADALAQPDPEADALARYVQTAEAELRAKTEALDAERSAMEASFAKALSDLKAELQARVARCVGKVRPRLHLFVRNLGPGRRILHLDRLDDDAAVILTYLLAGVLPTRHGFLRDDSTEDVSLPPAPLYPEEGVAADAVRPSAPSLAARFDAASGFVPIKGFLPLRLPRPEGFAFYRLLMRGPVLEVERVDGEGFSPLLAQDEAERLAGHLVRLKLAGKVELEIEAG